MISTLPPPPAMPRLHDLGLARVERARPESPTHQRERETAPVRKRAAPEMAPTQRAPSPSPHEASPVPQRAASPVPQRVREAAPVRDEPVKYPSLQALLIAASHCARAKGGPVTPYANRLAGLVGLRVADRIFVLDRSGLDKALRDERVSAIVQVLSGDNGWLVLANLLAEGWRPPGTTER